MIVPLLKFLNNSKIAPAPEAKLVKAPPPKEFDSALYRPPITLGDFGPKCQAHLNMEKNLFSQTGGSKQITLVLSNKVFYNLQVTTMLDGIVLRDCVLNTPIAVVVRCANSVFKIYSPRPNYSGQQPVTLIGRPFYLHATVNQVGKVLLHVVMEQGASSNNDDDDDNPTYKIHQNVSHPSRRYTTRHVIQHYGSTVASTRYGKEKQHSYMLRVHQGADACLMICLAAIGDERKSNSKITQRLV